MIIYYIHNVILFLTNIIEGFVFFLRLNVNQKELITATIVFLQVQPNLKIDFSSINK